MMLELDVRSYLIIAINFLVKLWVPLYFSRLSTFLDNSILFSTFINSFKSLKEGLFLINKLEINPYDGDIINHPPLLLSFFTLLNRDNSDFIYELIYAITDSIILVKLLNFNNLLKEKNKNEKEFNDEDYENEFRNEKIDEINNDNDNKIRNDRNGDYFHDFNVVLFYCFNPLILLSFFSKSTIIFTNLFIILMLNNLLTKNYTLSILQLSICSYLSYFPLYLIFPILNYIYQDIKSIKKIIKYLIFFIIFILLLSTLNFCFGFQKVINNCYLSIILFKKIQPNLGLWWYFFIEIFEFFNNFYIGLFNMYSFIMILPFTYKFNKEPMISLFLCISWIILTKNYPVIGDLNMFSLLILTIGSPLINFLQIPLLLINIVLFVVLVLLVLFYYLWMDLNSGNSNFFYGVGLVYNILIGFAIIDFTWSQLSKTWYEENHIEIHDDEERKIIKLTQI
ncbi:hypothetical protein PACTADRAFT_19002 [Pachysolen tannophilus NRRL Y-2460]|uniref:GPI transamidase subunit PIG-U n=1 Tax=Pachysolen tannophilus NRRL Y-2460 TaxID=669874 RepID=A0A1E4TPC6_PACTA|nr:hypothetical protein PACTADRAFT_19002 [Pachysolen tannophilus NRRL Y-2460]